MQVGDVTDEDGGALLDFEEFMECLARCGAKKYGEIPEEYMNLSQQTRGVIQNVLGLQTEDSSHIPSESGEKAGTYGAVLAA